MNISDLNHLEIVSEESMTDLIGGITSLYAYVATPQFQLGAMSALNGASISYSGSFGAVAVVSTTTATVTAAIPSFILSAN